MAEFVHGKTVARSFIVQTWSIMKETPAKYITLYK